MDIKSQVKFQKLSLYSNQKTSRKIIKKYYNKKTNKQSKKLKNEKQKTKNKKNPLLEPLRKPNPDEIRKMFGIALQRLVLVCLSNHVYKFKNVARKQNSGSATGLDLVNALSDLYLIW